MRKYGNIQIVLFVIMSLFAVSLSAQTTVQANRIIAKDSIKIGSRWVYLIETDTTLSAATNRTIPTSLAVKTFVENLSFSPILAGDTGAGTNDTIKILGGFGASTLFSGGYIYVLADTLENPTLKSGNFTIAQNRNITIAQNKSLKFAGTSNAFTSSAYSSRIGYIEDFDGYGFYDLYTSSFGQLSYFFGQDAEGAYVYLNAYKTGGNSTTLSLIPNSKRFSLYSITSEGETASTESRQTLIDGTKFGLFLYGSQAVNYATNVGGLHNWQINAVDKMRMDASGQLGIGTTSPSRLLDVAGEVRIRDLTTTTGIGLIAYDSDGVLSSVTIGSGLSLFGNELSATGGGGGGGGSTDLAFSGTSSPVTLTSSSGSDVDFIAGDGVAFLANSTEIEITNTGDIDASDDVTGSGTTGYLPKFIGAQELGNSLIQDDGTRVILNSPLKLSNWATLGRPAIPVSGDVGYNTTLGVSEIYNGSTWLQSAFPQTTTNGATLRYNSANGKYEVSTMVTNDDSYFKINTTSTVERFSMVGGMYMLTSGGLQIFRVRGSDGNISVGHYSAGFNVGSSYGAQSVTGSMFFMFSPSTWANSGTQGIGIAAPIRSNDANTAVNHFGFVVNDVSTAYAPTSGAIQRTAVLISNGINQTGTASGITRGQWVNPTITSAVDYRSIEIGTQNTMSLASTQLWSGIVINPKINQTGTGITRGIHFKPSITAANDFRAIDIQLTAGKPIYQSNSSLYSVHAGSIVIGDTVATPTANIDITGSIRVRPGITPASIEDGELYNNSNTFFAATGSLNTAISGTIYRGTTTATLSNSASETTITPSGTGTLTLPANYLVAGKTIRVKFAGNYSTDAVAAPDLNIKVKFGSTVVAQFGASELSLTSSGQIAGEFNIQTYTAGASGTVYGNGVAWLNYGTSGDKQVWNSSTNTTVTVDTTTSQAITLVAEWSTADTDNSITVRFITVEVL